MRFIACTWVMIVRVPRGQGGAASEEMHTAQALVFLAPWGQRPGYARIQADMQRALDGIAGVRSLVTMRQGLVRAGGTPVQLVLGKATGNPVAVIRGVDPAWFRPGEVRRELVRPPAEDLFR